MIHDDKNPKDHQDEFDDDLDDVEALDAFDDESWDDLDDDLDIEFDDVKDEDGSAIPPRSPHQKTFLQKFFIPIVVCVVAVFGLLFYLGQSGGSSGSKAPQQVLPAMEEADVSFSAPADIPYDPQQEDAGLPPMPNAMQSNTSEGFNLEETAEQQPELEVAQEQPLTPLPDESKDTKSLDLANLEETIGRPYEIRKAVPVEGIDAEPLAQETSDVGFQIDSEPQPSPFAASDTNASLETQTTDALPVVNNEPFSLEDAPVVSASIAPSPAIDLSQEKAEKEAISQEINALSETKSSLMSENTAIKNEINLAQSELKALEDKIAALAKEVQAKEEQSEELASEIKTLETKKTEVKKVESAPVVPQTPDPEPEEILIQKTVEAPKAPKPEAAKPTSAPISKPATQQNWVLRAASPGRASIAPKGSNDLKTVEVGNTVVGLGKITSIQVENGLWVVRGTKGTVSQ